MIRSCLKLIRIICISQCINSQRPIPCAVCSFRQCAAKRICQSKLYAHRLVHPVIGSKFGSKNCNWLTVGMIISIIGPFHRLHIGCQITIISIQVYAEKFTIRTIGRLHLRNNTSCRFQFRILKSGFTS